MGTAQVFISLMKFLLYSLVSSTFLVLLRCFWIFSFISTCLMVSTSNIPKYYYCHFTAGEFFTPALRVFHWSLKDSKSPQIFRTLLIIQADFSSAVVWMVLILPLNSSSSCLLSKFLGIVPTVLNFMLHSFFKSQWRSRYLSIFFFFFFAYFYFLSVVCWRCKIH